MKSKAGYFSWLTWKENLPFGINFQRAAWKMDPDWRFVFPIENGDIPASYVGLSEGTFQGMIYPSPQSTFESMMFLFPRWDMSVPWKVHILSLLRESFFKQISGPSGPVVDDKNLLVIILCSKNDDQKWQVNSLLVWEGQVKLHRDSLHELFIDKSVVNYLPSNFGVKTPEIRWLEDEFLFRIACSSAIFKECTV